MPRNVKTPQFRDYFEWNGWTPESALNARDHAAAAAEGVLPADLIYEALIQLDGSESLAGIADLRAHSVDDVLMAALKIIAQLNQKNRSAHIAHEIAATTGQVPQDYDEFEAEVEALYHEQVHGEPDESERGQEESQELTEGRQSGEEESLAECQEEEDRGRILSSPSRKRSDSSVVSDVSSKRPRFEREEEDIHEDVEEEEDREPSPEPPLFVPVRESTEPEAQPPPDGTTAQYEQLFERFLNGQLRRSQPRLSRGAPYPTRVIPPRSNPRGPKPTRCAVALLAASSKISSGMVRDMEKRLEFVGRAPAAPMQRRMLDEAALLDALYQRQSDLRDAADSIIQIGNGQAANDINRDEMSRAMRDALAAMRQAEREEKEARALLRHALE